MEEEKKSQVSYTIPGAIILAGLLVAGAMVYNRVPPREPGERAGAVAGSTVNPGNEGTANIPDILKNIADDDPILGNPSAPVTMVEFSDFQCPFCKRMWATTLPQIKEKYVKTGKVKFVYRDFPISSIHEHAQKAAEAAQCAHEQGKFWEYHDMLFENQSALGVANFKKWARELGLDGASFDQCLESDKYKAEVEKDLADGTLLGVQGTPGTFVNGELIVGAVPYEEFEKTIEAKLKEVGVQ